jgi:hypothetical protein
MDNNNNEQPDRLGSVQAGAGSTTDLEDAYLGAAALEAHRRSGDAAIPLAELMEELGLEG